MAINSIEVPCDKTLNELPEGHIADADISQDESICNLAHKIGRHKKKVDYKSPYLTGDSVQLLSRVTEKRFIHKKGGHLSSSALSGNIYKASSDDFKSLKSNGKKVFKSVLTLPTATKPAPKLCTVSDMNDTDDNEDVFLKKAKKRNVPSRARKCRSRIKGYDRDSQYCTDLDTHYDSSQDRLKHFGDGKRSYKSSAASRDTVKEKVNPHDIWAMLRNMNRFQFVSSPHMSEDSFITRNPKRRTNRKDLRVVETRRTEEFAYISSYKMDSPCFSHCSSFDKVTVINKKQNYKINPEIENKTLKKNKSKKYTPSSTTKHLSKSRTPLLKHNDIKAFTYETKGEVTEKFTENIPQLKCIENNTTSVDLGYESKTTENGEDPIVYENDTRDEMSQYSVVYSDNSGSSKAAFLKQAPHKKAKERLVTTNKDRTRQINGITKVTLSNFHNVETQHNADKIETPKKATRPISEVRTNPMPKLTKTEINRQLNKHKFPITVLGKDQLRSSIHVVNDEHPQFNGLDERIWPFMKAWYGIELPAKSIKKQLDCKSNAGSNELDRKLLWRGNSPKQKLKDNIFKIQVDRKHPSSPVSKVDKNMKIQNPIKAKPLQQDTDRMLELLYRNTTLRDVDRSHHAFGLQKRVRSSTKVNTSTGTELEFNNYYGDSISTYEHYSISSSVSNKNTPKSVKSCLRNHDDFISSNDKHSTTTGVTTKNKPLLINSYIKKRTWAKAKWASDFIENVMKKVGSGAYYSQAKSMCSKQQDTGIKDEENQTESNSRKELVEPMAIPGFDNELPEIEIETMNMKEVSVKHCVRNIILRFDVIVPERSIINAEIPPSIMPVSLTKSFTKVFNSRTSILNAMLPAELCSILPNLLRKIMESGEHLTIFSPPVEQITCLSTITESDVPTRCEHTDVTDTISSLKPMLSVNIFPYITITPAFSSMIKGKYNTEALNILHIFHPSYISPEHGISLAKDLKPTITRPHLFDCISNPILPLQILKETMNDTQQISTFPIVQQVNTCTALQPYNARDRQLTAGFRAINFVSIFESMATFMNKVGLWFSMSCNYADSNMRKEKLHKMPEIITLTITNSCKDDCYKSLISMTNVLLEKPHIEMANCSDNLQIAPSCNEDRQIRDYKSLPKKQFGVNINKTSRKRFGKLYRKCKSASNITDEEKTTPLNIICDLDDFFQVLGTAKLLASVFDGQSSLKLLTSLKEMKNWTNEINAKQALLLLLLSNKKDTPNLVRYLPVLLQGIAVKRITKVHEMDMEIEVIERENLNGISPRYEGISYLPASIENQYSLYEELCWIAKTTASDYQKPFNQTSERLLRSLLEKRKKLNPSYLRVMARYVGLGLLKTQGRKHT